MNLKELLEKRKALLDSIDEAKDMAAVEEIRMNLAKVEMQIAEAEKQEKRSDREALEAGSIPAPVARSIDNSRDEDLEYRLAFANFVSNGTKIPAELRASTKTTDVTAAIPVTVANQIINNLNEAGKFLARVTVTTLKAPVDIPKGDLRPIATWVAEGAGSAVQKGELGVVHIGAHKLRCEIGMTQEVTAQTLAVFETFFVKQVSQAMVVAVETAMFNGTGTGQPEGMFVNATAGINIPAAQAKFKYADIVAAEAELPDNKDNKAVWVMAKKTYLTQIVGMEDSNGQPIVQDSLGAAGKPEKNILGREVIFSDDYLPAYTGTKPSSDTIVAAIVTLEDYLLNKSYDLGVERKRDWDTEDIRMKAVWSCDGEAIDTTGIVKVTKKSS